ncbi:MAG: hypothetical protein M1816_000392 [Peltula sp. TS41687]|nr:MAG: hypothetical protein M1816_000392 [Peltula sp. TS41687]
MSAPGFAPLGPPRPAFGAPLSLLSSVCRVARHGSRPRVPSEGQSDPVRPLHQEWADAAALPGLLARLDSFESAYRTAHGQPPAALDNDDSDDEEDGGDDDDDGGDDDDDGGDDDDDGGDGDGDGVAAAAVADVS